MLKNIVLIGFLDLMFFMLLGFGFGYTIQTWSFAACCGVILAFLIAVLQELIKLKSIIATIGESPAKPTIKFARRDFRQIKYKNVILMLKDHMPIRNFLSNLFKGHISRKFNLRSHLRFDGTPKITYYTKARALKAKSDMEAKNRGTNFCAYKCVYCKGFHLGSNTYYLDK